MSIAVETLDSLMDFLGKFSLDIGALIPTPCLSWSSAESASYATAVLIIPCALAFNGVTYLVTKLGPL